MGDHTDSRLENFVRALGAAESVSGAVALIGDATGVLASAATGRRSMDSPSAPTPGSLFDLASLSKPITATLALSLDDAGLLPLDLRVGELWPSADRRMAVLRLEQLLRHRSGLEPWAPLYALASRREEAVEILLSGDLLVGGREVYSDLGYILWARAAERALGRRLDELLRDWVLKPLGLTRQIFVAQADPRRRVDCRLDRSRERELAAEKDVAVGAAPPQRGEIQDGNAAWMGAFAGHAGLLGSARGLWRLGAEWLAPEHLSRAAVEKALAGTGRFALGWWRRRVRGPAGPGLGEDAFGHTGFTGGSLWIDPARQKVFVLLAHRLSQAIDLDPWRRRMHALT